MGLRGSRSGVLKVRRSSDIGAEVIDDQVQCYRSEIVSLNACIEKSLVDLTVFYDQMTVKVSVNTAQIVPAKIVGMHWNVREDQAAWQCVASMVKHSSANVFKMLSVVFQLECVVVAANENLSPIAPVQVL